MRDYLAKRISNISIKPWPNRLQHVGVCATLLHHGNMLRAFGHHVARCCTMLHDFARFCMLLHEVLFWSNFRATFLMLRGVSRTFGHSMQQCCVRSCAMRIRCQLWCPVPLLFCCDSSAEFCRCFNLVASLFILLKDQIKLHATSSDIVQQGV